MALLMAACALIGALMAPRQDSKYMASSKYVEDGWIVDNSFPRCKKYCSICRHSLEGSEYDPHR